MQKKTNFKLDNLYLILIIAVFLTVSLNVFADNTDDKARTPDEILAEFKDDINNDSSPISKLQPSKEAIWELFLNVSEWDEKHKTVRDSSRKALIELGEKVVPVILEKYLATTDVRRRIERIAVLKGIGEKSLKYLIPHIKSNDMFERANAAQIIYALAEDKLKQEGVLISSLDNEKFEKKDAIRKTLVEAIKKENKAIALRSLVYALGTIGDENHIDILSAFFKHDDESVRLSTVKGLGFIINKKVVSIIIDKGFTDEISTVRQASIVALSRKIMGKTSFDLIIEHAQNENNTLQKRLCCLETINFYLEILNLKKNETDKEVLDQVLSKNF